MSCSGNVEHPSDPPDFTEALLEFQRVSGLPITGVFDDATKAAMNKPRCGVTDKKQETSVESTVDTTTQDLHETIDVSLLNNTESNNDTTIDVEIQNSTLDDPGTALRKKSHLMTLMHKSKRRKRSAEAFWGHMAFSKSVLKWRLIGEGYSSQLSVDEQRYVFRLAFRMWSEVSPLEFLEDLHSPLEEIDIRLGFGTVKCFYLIK